MKINISKIIVLISFAGVVQSCKVAKDYEKPILDPKFSDNLYRNSKDSDTVSISNVPYKTIFTDPKLQTIIEKTINNNLDLKIAISNINEAQAVFVQSKSQFLPTLDATASVKDTKNSPAAQGSNFRMPDIMNYQLALSTSWEDRKSVV